MQITLFAIPKGFRGIFKTIQTNAIHSWTLLQPRPEIILLGDDEGTAEFASGLGVRHVSTIDRNEYGTPLANGIFEAGQRFAHNPLVCYVNSDIILMSEFVPTVERVADHFGDQPFLIIGRKTNIEIPELLDFGRTDWEMRLKQLANDKGKYVTYDSDFFVFPRGMFEDMPRFALGRCYWTQWLIYDARRRGIPVIDASAVVMSIESKHDYSHARSTGGAKRLSGVEYETNKKLFKGCKYLTVADSTLILNNEGSLSRAPLKNRVISWCVRLEYFAYFLLKGSFYPYSLPLIVVLRRVVKLYESLFGISKAVRKPVP